MDWICIEGLRLQAVIGVYRWERALRQPLRLELELAFDIGAAAASDDIADALDYGEVAAAVSEFAQQSRFQLVEALAEAIAELVLQRFAVAGVKVRLAKPVSVGAAGNFNAIVRIERWREQQ